MGTAAQVCTERRISWVIFVRNWYYVFSSVCLMLPVYAIDCDRPECLQYLRWLSHTYRLIERMFLLPENREDSFGKIGRK